MTTHTIPQKMSGTGTGTIHDIASDLWDRDIEFARGCKYAVVLAAYYGGQGYTTHKTEAATIAASRAARGYSHVIIDDAGNQLDIYGDKLVRV